MGRENREYYQTWSLTLREERRLRVFANRMLSTVFGPQGRMRAYDSVRGEVLYNILIEFGIPMKWVRLIKTCLTETYSRIRVGNHLSGMFFY